MLTDHQILHISENAGVAEIKSAYRKRVKEVHPDVAGGSFEAHLMFICINQAYRRLMGKNSAGSTAAEKKPDVPGPVSGDRAAGIVRHKDPAYAFYKAGMKEYMKIHPSQWSAEIPEVSDNPGPEELQKLKEIEDKVKNLVKGFPRAYYYFSIVVYQFPGSVWQYDAAEKMKLIEERTLRYKKIIESFSGHAKSAPRVNKMFINRKK